MMTEEKIEHQSRMRHLLMTPHRTQELGIESKDKQAVLVLFREWILPL